MQPNRYPQPQIQNSAESRPAEERGTKEVPLVVEVAPSKEARKQTDEDAKERKSKASSDWWLIVLTGVLALATIALVVVTGGIVWFAWRQARDMKDSIAHAETAAKAAIDSAGVAKDTLIASNRAWIEPIVEKADDSLILNKHGASYAIKITFTNTGNIPATNISYEGWLVGRKMSKSTGAGQVSPIVPHRKKCHASRNRPNPIVVGNMLCPGEEFPSAQRYTTVEIGCSMSGEELDSVSFIDNGKSCVVLYAGGAINYTFATDKETHQTSFLYEITFRGASCSFDIGQEIHPADNLTLGGIPEGDGRQAD